MNHALDKRRMRSIKRAIVVWYSTNGREFPWRSTSNPYQVLVAEMLLRRTTAVAVARVYQNFIHRFNRPELLANAQASEIASMIKTLGLQRVRSQHLRQMARCLVDDYHSDVPEEFTQLAELPGVGQYVASAVLNFAFDSQVPLVDGNVNHLMSRLFGISFTGPVDHHLFNLLKSFDLETENRSFYWGIIDLVAKVCLRKAPRCGICPLQEFCVWRSRDITRTQD